MLSPLQRQILGIVGGLPEAAPFALAGGAALILRGTVDRGTNDLDFFIGAREMLPGAIHRVVEATETALAAAGLAVTREAMSETFARLTVADRDDGCRIDFASDVRIREPDGEGSTAILSLEELAADKVLALFGRAAARDFQDVAALRRRFSWEQLFALATEKDAGFSRDRFLAAVAAFHRLEPDEFDLSASGYRQLRDEVNDWPSQIDHRRGPRRGR